MAPEVSHQRAGLERVPNHQRNDGMFSRDDLEAQSYQALLESARQSAQPVEQNTASRAVDQLDRGEGGSRFACGNRVGVDVGRTGLAEETDDGGVGRDVPTVHTECFTQRSHEYVARRRTRVFLRTAAGGSEGTDPV